MSYALKELDVDVSELQNCYMVGDSVESDIRGAIDAGICPILYDPLTEASSRYFLGRYIPVIRSMDGVMDVLNLSEERKSHR